VSNLLNFPIYFSIFLFVALWLSVRVGMSIRERRSLEPGEREDFDLIVTATLTLLALIIGFSFSMAISRYDQRKSYEEQEANAIGTEYIRADLLSAPDAARVHKLLSNYLSQRISFYQTRGSERLRQIDIVTSQIETDLWSAVANPAEAQPTAVSALVVSGMNDVLNSRGRTRASWWNRIPSTAWILMSVIAVCSNLLIGFGARSPAARAPMLLVLPFVISIAFYLMADLDSPRSSMIRVQPENLVNLSNSLRML
jgi:protein-S-isoprenylcysteine O-methyltransferase Ste14